MNMGSLLAGMLISMVLPQVMHEYGFTIRHVDNRGPTTSELHAGIWFHYLAWGYLIARVQYRTAVVASRKVSRN